MKIKSVLLSTFTVVLIIGNSGTLEAQSPNVSLEDIFVEGKFRSERFGPARWLSDGERYATLERSSQGTSIVAYSADGGDREELVSAKELTPTGAERGLGIGNYIWSKDESKILIFTNTRRVWRANTKGDYWYFNLETKELKKLGQEFEESTLMFAKFSPDNSRVAYVQKHNLFVEDLDDSRVKQLTSDGSRTIINGTFDWVYEEEFFLRDGFRWSPDGSKIAFWQLDASGIKDFLMINNTDSLYSFVVPVQYPKAGQTNSASKVGVVSASGGDTKWFSLSDDERNHYVARMDWASDSKEIIIQHLNRAQNRNEVILGDVASGSHRVVYVDEDDTWLDVVDDLIWSTDGQSFTWVTQSDGWKHVYRIDRKSGDAKLLTPGNYDVMSIVELDEDQGQMYFMASPENATQLYLYQVALDGKGEKVRITPKAQPGFHRYQISAGGKFAIHNYSSFDRVPVTELISLPDHKLIQQLVLNESLSGEVAQLKRPAVNFFQVKLEDGSMMDGWEMRPRDFDPTNKYPVLFYVYGEPWGQTAADRWGGSRYLWHHHLTELGYIVMSVDNRGTPVPKGRAWRKSVYGEIGTLASIDQATAVNHISEISYVDSSRIGIWGWSGGGSMTLNALFRYPELYKMGMSVAPVPDQRYYDTIYQERYSGNPHTNAEGYKNGSPITYAQNLKGKLLLVHGTGDDNVHYQGTEALINKLIEHNKQFDFMSYPNRSHGIFEGRGTTLHLYTMLTNYVAENL